MLALTTPRESCRVDSAHRMIQATSADLPMPWPEAMATRTASISAAPERAVEQAVAQPDQHLALPRLRAALLGERRVRHAPGEGEQDEAQGIEAEGADLAMERLVEISDGRHRAPAFRPPPARAALVGDGVLVLDALAPLLAAAVAQPEDGGLGVGREIAVVLDLLRFAGDRQDLHVGMGEALGLVQEREGDVGVGDVAALLHGLAEVRDSGRASCRPC